MDDDDLVRMLAAGAMAGKAENQANEAEAQRQEQSRRQTEIDRQNRQNQLQAQLQRARRLDSRITGLALPVLGVAAVASAIFFAVKMSDQAPDAGQLAKHVWWIVVAVVLAIVGIGAAACIRPPWEGRMQRVVLSGATIVAVIVGLVYTFARINYQEVMATEYPFGSKYLMCGDAVKIPVDTGHETELWQLYRGQLKGSEGDGCNRLSLYRGKDEVSVYNLPAGEWFLPETAPDGGAAMFAALNGEPIASSDVVETSLSNITFFARTDRNRVISVSPADPSSWK